mmetsp:Transcript_23798/g.34734  ORF Transcript_23798/g.34734 Transcript_23798/m.34734 type:complete len:107 (+) Transcript_23798:461-781(+)
MVTGDRIGEEAWCAYIVGRGVGGGERTIAKGGDFLVSTRQGKVVEDINKVCDILTHAFAANPDSDSVWLAAVKLEWEYCELERAHVLLTSTRDCAGTDRMYMKSAL